jgi:hypothetical protein
MMNHRALKVVTIVAVAIALASAACRPRMIEQLSFSEIRELRAEIDRRCAAQKAGPGTKDYEECFIAETRREDANRRDTARRLDAVADSLSRRPITCTTVGTVTNCW